MIVNKRFDTGVIKFNLRDEEDEVFCSFRMNPTDIHLLNRAVELSDYFEERVKEVKEYATPKELEAFNDEIEEKINCFLGYDASKDIFGVIPATTVNPDGEMFVQILMKYIAEILEPEMKKRKINMESTAKKYTEKYEK